MAATATAGTKAPARRSAARVAARRAPAVRKAPARSAPRPRRRQQTPVGGFVPVAVGRTAGAVGGIADSGIVVRLTRGRLWIGMLGGLLVGIVALNVIALSFSSSSSEAGRQADALKRQNSAYRAQIATLTASQEIQETATRLGLYIPNPNEVGYLRPSPDDAAEAAKRLRAGELSVAEYVPPAEAVETAVVVPAESVVAPEATVADPAATAAATTPPAEPETAAPPAVVAPVSGGGVSSP